MSARANSPALISERVAWISRRSPQRRGTAANDVPPGTPASAATSRRRSPRRDERQLGRDQRRREQARAAPPGRCGSASPSGCAPGSATSPAPCRTRTRGRRGRRRRRPARRRPAGREARGRRPRGRGRSLRRSRRAARTPRGGSRGRPRTRSPAPDTSPASSTGSPAPPAQAIPVKCTTPPRVLMTLAALGRDERLPGGPARAVAKRRLDRVAPALRDDRVGVEEDEQLARRLRGAPVARGGEALVRLALGSRARRAPRPRLPRASRRPTRCRRRSARRRREARRRAPPAPAEAPRRGGM